MAKKIDFGKALAKAKKNQANLTKKKAAPKKAAPKKTAKRKTPAAKPGSAVFHVAVDALPGTGKTFTLVVGVAWMFRHLPGIWEAVCEYLRKEFNKPEGWEPEPSPEQRKIWDAMTAGKLPRFITYMAYNKSIVKDFGAKWAFLCDMLKQHGIGFGFRTCHSTGFSAVCKAYNIGIENIDEHKTKTLIENELGQDLRDFAKAVPGGDTIISATDKLVEQCKLNVVNLWEMDEAQQREELDKLCIDFDIDLEGMEDRVFELVPKILDASREETRVIDFNDQVWLPVVNNLPVFVNDLTLGDEAQDWNKAQQQILLKVSKPNKWNKAPRLFVVGDVNQSIYGWAGADTDSIPRMKEILKATPQGLQSFKLTETRRCSKAIVKDCQELIPEFKAHPDNAEGSVSRVMLPEMFNRLGDGDLVLCRTTAPLVAYAFRLVKMGVKANINGRKIGEALLSLMKRLKGKSVEDMIERLDKWHAKEAAKLRAKKYVSDNALIALNDKRDCLEAFTEGAETLQDVRDAINKVFDNAEAQGREGVLLSTVHRAKGMEARTMYIVHPELIPHPAAKSAKDLRGEFCVDVVARSRGLENLVRVDCPK